MGIVVDTFSSLRESKRRHEEVMNNKCFICDLDKIEDNIDIVYFTHHVVVEHNMWNYFYYYFYLIKMNNKNLNEL